MTTALSTYSRKLEINFLRARQYLRARKFVDENKVLAFSLEQREIPLVVDVGANVGQFARKLFRAGYGGRILSFEPFADARATLTRAASSNPRWQVGPAIALGRESGSACLHIAGNSVSSSLLPMESLHVEAAAASAEVGMVPVDVRRLDDVLMSMGIEEERFFLKLDTQGSEKAILEGSSKLLHRIVGIEIELSFAPLYVGQPLFDEVYEFVRARGFEPWNISPAFRDGRTGRLLQCDAVFFRRDDGLKIESGDRV